MNNKVVVIGLDGGTFKLLKPLVKEGLMPNLKKILDEGAHSVLESTIPPMTGTAWSTFATGKGPGKHGVYDFLMVDDSLENFHITTSKDIQGKTIYEMMSESGKTPVTINLPNSWPPRLKDKEIVITSILTQGDQWIWPESLKEEIPELKNYKLTPNESLRLKERKDQYADEVLELVDTQMKSVKKIFKQKPWDFFFYLFSSTDWIQHASYDELTERREQAQSPLRIYKQVDEYLGWFMENMPENTDLLIMSDHGFKAFKKTFYFNKWLEQEGFLATKDTSDDFKQAVTRRAKETEKIRSKKKRLNLGKGFFKVMKKMPFLEKPLKLVYHKVVKKYLPVNLKVDIGIDYKNTRVCFPKGSYMTNAYINDGRKYPGGPIKSDEEFKKTQDEVITKIKNLRAPDGQPVVSKIYTKEAIYGENSLERCPDLFFDLGDYWFDGQFSSSKIFEDGTLENKHDKDGIFLAWGPNIKKGLEIKEWKHIQDIAPTILHMMDLPVPNDMDGKVMQEIFTEQKDVKYQSDKQEIDTLIDNIDI